jgi:hypothetical protein
VRHRRDSEAGHDPAEHTVADDQVRRRKPISPTGMPGCGRERQQHGAVTQVVVDGNGPHAGKDQPGSGAAEETANVAEAARARHENAIADAQAGARPG